MTTLSARRGTFARRFRTSGSRSLLACGGHRAAALAIVFAVLCGPAGAQLAAQAPSSWFDRLDRSIVVDADGSFVEVIDDEMGVGALVGVSEAVQRVLYWNASSGTVEVLAAETIKPDGRRIPAPAEMVIEGSQSEQGGLFQDQHYKIISFVELEPGDHIRLKARHHRTVPFFPGHFFDQRDVPSIPVRELTLVYDLPDSMPLRHDAVGFELTGVERGNGRVRYEWHYAGARPPVAERQVVAASDYADRLFVSTLPSYRALAYAFLQGAYPAGDPTPQIRELARRVTTGAGSTRERVARLYDWVRNNVAYGGAYLGRESVVPHPAQRTLEDRRGDCKDHAILFEALLAAVGIDSSPVMVNATNAYRIPAVPTIGVLNHVMTWIPALQTFADSSAASIPFGELPTAVSDKPALITKSGELTRTPPQRPIVESIDLSGEIDAYGEARFRLVDTARGWVAGTRRRSLEQADLAVLERVVDAMLRSDGIVVRARPENGDDRAGDHDAGPARLRISGRISGMLTDDAVPRLRALSTVGGGIEQALADFIPARRRSAPALCIPAHVEERARWRLARGLELRELPGGLTIDGDGFRYRSEFRRIGRVLEIRRSLAMDFDTNACAPERLRIVQRLAQEVLEDLNATARVRVASAAAGRR